ncbi:unnamed protein product [marine sediment metagenome]|uniref:Uncharacterized protein n=1 Tax=marine sediment metagenome TaxID=412755 RepID=X0Z1C0_9ZZZZ
MSDEVLADYKATIEGPYDFTVGASLQDMYILYLEQRRRALITELRALDRLLGRRQTIPRKE